MKNTGQKGRPAGQEFPHIISLRFGEKERQRLDALKAKLEMKDAALWRLALKKLAEAEGVE